MEQSEKRKEGNKRRFLDVVKKDMKMVDVTESDDGVRRRPLKRKAERRKS